MLRPSRIGVLVKKLILLLVPLSLFAQVVVDTVIRLPEWLNDGCFMPEINKLCVTGESAFYILDCSTYQVRARIPMPRRLSLTHYTWNWRRQKLYVSCSRPESTLVLDATGDSILRWLTVSPEFHVSTYVSDVDRLYKPANETLDVFDCSTDTVVRRVLPTDPRYGFGYATSDSVGRKLYVGMCNLGSPPLMGVYDYVNDSFTKVMDVSAISALQPVAMVINSRGRRACIADNQVEPLVLTNVGIADLEHDSFLRTLPATIEHGLFRQVASDERDGKIYIASSDGKITTPDSLWVYDCATDSVARKVEYVRGGYGALCIRWVPWSNRLYLGCHMDMDHQTLDTSIVVVDCKTDSIIERLPMGHWGPRSIQLDPVRQRVFIIGADSGTIHVLRDTGYAGVAESPSAHVTPRRNAEAHVVIGYNGIEVEYQLPAAARVRATLHDAVGRQASVLDIGVQEPGTHRLSWNQDGEGRRLASGAYFVLLDMGQEQARLKVVVR